MYEIDETLLQEARDRIARERKWDVILQLQPPANVSLQGSKATVNMTRHRFRFGCNGFLLRRIEDRGLAQAYEEQFAALLNFATLPYYWASYEPELGKTRYAEVREMAAWCKEHGIAGKGHPLTYSQTCPAWLNALPDNEVLDLQRKRVHDLVRDFRGFVDTWDVVNEAFWADRYDNAVGRWISGARITDAVDELIRLAHEGNPDAQLLYNDANIRIPEHDALIKALIERGSPMGAIGLQSHMHVFTWPLREAWTICEQYARFGLPLHFTELTVLSGRAKDPQDRDWHRVHTDWLTTPEGEATQALYGEAFYTLLYSHPAVEAITWWDFSDYHSWQGAPAGLVRADMSPKPLYERLMALVWGEWATHAEATIGEAPTMLAHCAAGQHRVEVALPSGDTLSGTFTISPQDSGPVTVQLA